MNVLILDSCPACGSRIHKKAFSPDNVAWQRFQKLSARKYQGYMDDWVYQLDLTILQCISCHHYWHHTIPDQESLFAMYNAAVPLRKVAPIEPDARILKSVSALYKLAKLRFNEKPRLLDYGSGFGRWAKAAIQVGFDVVAYEPSAERGKKSGELLTYRVVANITDLRGEKFHVFNFEQVLEHTPDPLVVLSNIYPLSTKNSIIRVTVPNIEKESDDIWNSFPFDGERMHVLSPYEHLQGFCPSSLERLLFRAKMKYLKNSDVLITHPQYLLRRSLQNYISSIGQTMAIVSWPSYP